MSPFVGESKHRDCFGLTMVRIGGSHYPRIDAKIMAREVLDLIDKLQSRDIAEDEAKKPRKVAQ
jgi:hypothetical protein